MSWVFLALRKSQLKQRLNVYQNRLLQISQRIMDMQQMAANIADGKITYQEMGQTPSSVFGSQMNYMTQSAPIAYQSASIKTDAFLQNMDAINQGTGGQYLYGMDGMNTSYLQNGQISPFLVFNDIYEQELKAFADQYAQEVNREEAALEQEKITLETQIKAIEAEYKSVDETLGQNIDNDAIQL